jgi:hypothetical protein
MIYRILLRNKAFRLCIEITNTYRLLALFYISFDISIQNTLTINALVGNYKDLPMSLDLVKVLGLNKTVTNVNVNGKAYPNFLYNIPDDVCI